MDDKIYKYTSIKSAISILKSNSVLLNNPKNFNDPYDCDFVQDKADYKKCQKLIKEYSIMKVFFLFLEQKKLKFSGKNKLLIKALKAELEATKKSLEKKEFYEGNPLFSKINDLISKKNYEFKTKFDLAIANYNKKVNEAFEKIKDMALISCFSKTNRSILMWSHYADSHHGVCIEWDRPGSDVFRDVKYQKNKQVVSLYKILSHSLALDLLKKKDEKKYSIDEFKEFLYPIFTKSNDWSYEEEVRCLYSSESIKKPLIINDDDKIALEMKKPTAIYVGCKSYESDLDTIIELANNRKIPVYFMKDSKYSFEMEIDCNRKFTVRSKSVKKDITLLRLIDDINKCLNSGIYLSAFISALIIPTICSQIEIRGKDSEKNKYIKWIDNYFIYEQLDDNFLHLNGQICWDIKERINSNAIVDISNLNDKNNVKFVKLRAQKRNCNNNYANSNGKEFILINITDFCVKMIDIANRCYKNNKEKVERMKQIDIEDFDEILLQV